MPSSHTKNNPQLAQKIAQMALPLAPLVRLTTGEIHTSFPLTLLNFWLLTSDQMDDLAHFYHQRTPSVYTQHYPCPVDKEWRCDATLEEKRRRIGRFIGLRGCESPVRGDGEVERMREREMEMEMEVERREHSLGRDLVEMEAVERRIAAEREVMETEFIEREVRERRWKDEEAELLKKKMRWY